MKTMYQFLPQLHLFVIVVRMFDQSLVITALITDTDCVVVTRTGHVIVVTLVIAQIFRLLTTAI